MTKYRAIPCEVDGVRFASQKEGRRYSELKMLLRSGIIRDLTLQRKFPFIINGVNLGSYVADFVYTDRDGREVVEDVKGFKTPVYKLKAKLMLACHGLRILET